MTSPVRAALIGVGGMARYHIRQMLKMQSTTRIVALCEPSEAMALEAAKVFVDAGLPPPPNQPDWQKLIAEYGAELDAVFIITPHALHHDQTRACLEAGIDVLLEKPMVMTAAEAHSLIETRDRTGRLLVVAFQGSLSPQVRLASRLLRANEFGRILTYQWRRLAELGSRHCEHLAAGARPLGRWLSVRHGRTLAQHRCRSGRGRV